MASVVSLVSGYMGEDKESYKCFRALRVKAFHSSPVLQSSIKAKGKQGAEQPASGSIYKFLYFASYNKKKNDSLQQQKNDHASGSTTNNQNGNDERIIFVCNIGQDDDEDYLRGIFTQFGDINNVVLSPSISFTSWNKADQQIIDPYQRHALITFAKEKGAKNAMGLVGVNIDESKAINDGEADEDDEMQQQKKKKKHDSWQQIYNASIIPRNALKEKTKKYMSLFHTKEAQLLKEKQRLMPVGVPDEDGFVTVTSKKRARKEDDVDDLEHIGISENGTGRTASGKLPRSRKKKSLVIENFYKFQKKQSQISKLKELRKKFNEDKKRVEKQKMSRKFNPF